MSSPVTVCFWGVRGSIPVPGSETVVYGGNTPCIEVVTPTRRIILDAGTGIRALGQSLAEQTDPLQISVLFSHTHWDHIQGLPFFNPLFQPGNEIEFFGPFQEHGDIETSSSTPFRELLKGQMEYTYFPVQLREIEQRSSVQYNTIGEETFQIGGISVQTFSVNHTVYTLGFRLSFENVTIVYTADHEPYDQLLKKSNNSERSKSLEQQVNKMKKRFRTWCNGADLLITDAQFTDQEYPDRVGWGHSSLSHCLQLAEDTRPEQFVFFHYKPARTDQELKQLEEESCKKLHHRTGGEVEGIFAKEGMKIELETT